MKVGTAGRQGPQRGIVAARRGVETAGRPAHPEARHGGPAAARARRREPLLLGLAIGALGVLLVLTPWGARLEEALGLRWLFTLRGPIPAPDGVVLVDMDRDSAARLGLPERPRDWPRRVHGCLVDRLSALGAAAVVFDVAFVAPSRGRVPPRGGIPGCLPPAEGPGLDPAGDDAAFAAALRRAGNVALFLSAELEPMEVGGLAVERERLHPPVGALARAAAAVGPFPLPKVPARLNRFWTRKRLAGEVLPTLPLLALHLAAGERLRHLDEPARGALPAGAPGLPSSRDLAAWCEALGAHPGRAEALADRLSEGAEDPPGGEPLRALLAACGGPAMPYLNLYGPPGQVAILPYHRVLSPGGGPLPDLAGRAVFVGEAQAARTHQSDGFYTVFSRSDGVDLSGAEVAATAYLNLLHTATLRPLHPAAGALACLALSLLYTLSVGALRPVSRGVAGALALAAGYAALAQHLFGHQHLWLPLAGPLLVLLPLALAGGVWLQYRTSRHSGERFSRALGYYAPRQAEALLDDDGTPSTDPELTFGICLVTDIQDYTTLAEDMAPDALARLTNRYFERLGGLVAAHGGQLLSVLGDGATSVWTASGDDPARRLAACRAALAIHRAVEPAAGDPDLALPTRLGLHAGRVAMGNLGGGGHLAYSVIGDIVNAASRLEGLNKHLGTRLLASEAMVAALDGTLLLRPLGRFLLKGKSEPLGVYEVLGTAEQAHARDLWQVERFAAALAHLEARRYAQAIAGFSALLDEFPEDAPSRFYLRRSQACARRPDAAPTPIRIDTK